MASHQGNHGNSGKTMHDSGVQMSPYATKIYQLVTDFVEVRTLLPILSLQARLPVLGEKNGPTEVPN